jgi:hypothetical protein
MGDTILKKAELNLRMFLKSNIKEILNALNAKVRKDGIVIYVLYAQLFHAVTKDCAKQSWRSPMRIFLKPYR